MMHPCITSLLVSDISGALCDLNSHASKFGDHRDISRGRLQLLELLLQFGADSRVRASNGWTAAEFCKKTGQLECQQLLEEVRASEGRPRTPPSLPPAPSISPEQQRLVELYLSTVDEDRVDCDLVLHLLLHIHTTQGPGAVLVFLPGYEDIAGVRDLVGREQALSDVNLLVLHSQVVYYCSIA